VIEKELLHTVAGNENWYSHYGEQGGVSFKKKKVKTVLPYYPAIPFLDIFPKK
jgi:hypothetical protein